MKRNVGYTWHLAELMARHGLHNTTDLIPLLAERGIDLSPAQTYRIVTGKPERVSLHTVAAICDIFECEVADLVTFTATTERRKKPTADNVFPLAGGKRPARAHIINND